MGDLNLFIAFAAGLLSFLSPCVLPLVPSYLSYVAGVSVGELRDNEVPSRAEVAGRTAMFILGFTLVFAALGVLFSGSAVLVGGVASWLNLAAGAVVILLGLNVIFDFASFLNRERRVGMPEKPSGYAGSAAFGMAFGAGWTPCIGPVLASILFLAGTGSNVGQGALLLFVYSLGLGTPFLLVSIFLSRTLRYLDRIKPWLPHLKVATGGLLIAIGVLIAGGRLQNLQAALFRAANQIEQWAVRSPVMATWGLGAIAAALTVAPFVPAFVRRFRRRERQVRVVTPTRAVVAAVFGLLTALHATGVLPLAEALALWFTYEGI